MKTYFINTLKSIIVLILGSFVFVSIITIFPLIGSFTTPDFPIKQVIKENFQLMIPLSIVSFIIAPLLGLATKKVKKKRMFYLLIIGLFANWIAIIAVMLFWSKFTIYQEDLLSAFIVSLFALIIYSLFSLPILIPSMLILEKWTRNNQFIRNSSDNFK